MGQTESKVGEGDLPQVVKDCDEVLQDYSKEIAKEYDEGKELFATAKKMWQDVRYHIDNDRRELSKNNCTKEQCQIDLTALQKKQEDLWETILAKADAQKGRVEEMWHKVELAEQAVDKERGYDKFNSSWGQMPTGPQKQVRHYYQHKLTPTLKEAKKRAQEFIGFPDGYDTRVRLLHKQTAEQTEKAMESLD